MTLGIAEGECRGKVFQLGEARHIDAKVIQDDSRIGVENVYKLVPKASMNEM